MTDRRRTNLSDEERRRRRLKVQSNCNVLTRHGVSVEEYQQMLVIQKGVCGICREKRSTGERLAVDHDHKTGKIRGLLCRRCNRGIGHFEDEARLLMIAADYLRASSDGTR